MYPSCTWSIVMIRYSWISMGIAFHPNRVPIWLVCVWVIYGGLKWFGCEASVKLIWKNWPMRMCSPVAWQMQVMANIIITFYLKSLFASTNALFVSGTISQRLLKFWLLQRHSLESMRRRLKISLCIGLLSHCINISCSGSINTLQICVTTKRVSHKLHNPMERSIRSSAEWPGHI